MPLISWDSVEKEILSETIGRKVINGEKVGLVQVFLAKDAAIPQHQHESEEMGYTIEGSAKVEVEGKEFIVHKGEVMHIPGNVPHSVVALEDSVILYAFSPIRQDWLDGKDDYLRQ
jgi:quercetin dioxygenase-like cupin family protein